MSSPNEFWLDLHRLSQSYNAEGLTTNERAANIIGEFRSMPPATRRHVLEDLIPLVLHLADLRALVIAAASGTDGAPR